MAFAGLILIQVVLFAAFSALVSNYWSSHFLIALALAGLPLIGAGNYFLFQSLTRAESIGIGAEKWLARRDRETRSSPKQRNVVKRFAPWVPTLVVIGMCSFLGETFAIASHMIHPGSSKVLRYQVSVPLTWIVTPLALSMDENSAWSAVRAMKLRGAVNAGLAAFQRQAPPLFLSEMSFYGERYGDPLRAQPPDDTVSTRTFPLVMGTITCWEYIPKYHGRWGDDGRFITCSTPQSDFYCGFAGNKEDVPDFYRTLNAIKPSE